MNNYNNKNSRKDIDEMGKKIMEWLKEEEMYKESVINETIHFGFVAKNPNAPIGSFTVAQPKVREDLVLIVLTLEFGGDLFEKLRKMSSQEKIDFWTSFKLGIVFATPTFLLHPSEDAPKTIEFRREIYYDGLTKDRLMEAIRDLHRCLLYSNLKFIPLRGKSNAETPMFG